MRYSSDKTIPRFIIQQAKYHKPCEGDYKLDILSYKKDNYIIGCKTSNKTTSTITHIQRSLDVIY